MINSRRKGKTGELQVIHLLQPIVDRVYGAGVKQLRRNLDQARDGGSDILGLEWASIEVKRYKGTALLAKWWVQTMKQTQPNQTPFLFHRQDNQRGWYLRIVLRSRLDESCYTVDLHESEALRYFEDTCKLLSNQTP